MRIFIKLLDGTTRHATFDRKRKVMGILTNLLNNDAVLIGTARITYRPGFYNEFDFDGKEDFVAKFLPCVEKETVDEYTKE